jgi:allantoin racemase
VPVVDPALAALKLAEGLGDMGLCHSKRTYPLPPPEEVAGYSQEGRGGAVVSRPGELQSEARIRVILPVVGERRIAAVQEIYGRAGRAGTEISVVSISSGPSSIESGANEALAIPGLLSRVRTAEAEGMDAVIIDCMADLGLVPARELASIPVIGPGQAAMHLAAMLGQRFSIIVPLEEEIPRVRRQVLSYGLGGKVASVRAINVPAPEIGAGGERVIQALIEESVRAVREDGAHLIVPGCTAMIGMATAVREGLVERGCEVPVIDPVGVVVKLAEGLVDMGLVHSKRTYPLPPDKEIVGYP